MINTYQQTLKNKITFHGYGIHTGKFAEVTLAPLDEDQGIIFRSENKAKKYLAENISGDARGTQVILDKENKIMTVEHLVSALAGMGIDNVLIDVEGPEVPAKDGSPSFFTEKIIEAGILKQNKPKNFFKVKQREVLIEKDKAILVLPAETLKITFLIDYPDNIVKTDIFSLDLAQMDYQNELGRARTYGFKNELAQLLSSGLALGATVQNAIVVSPEGFSCELNYPDELVRHKVVDFIGDIMALGALPLGEFYVIKSGHQLNFKFVQKLLAA